MLNGIGEFGRVRSCTDDQRALADWRATHDFSYEQNLSVAGAKLGHHMLASKSKAGTRRTPCLKPISARNAGKGLSATTSAVKTRLYD